VPWQLPCTGRKPLRNNLLHRNKHFTKNSVFLCQKPERLDYITRWGYQTCHAGVGIRKQPAISGLSPVCFYWHSGKVVLFLLKQVFFTY
jgi:hypothetical protein